jgi:hypothetical protein
MRGLSPDDSCAVPLRLPFLNRSTLCFCFMLVCWEISRKDGLFVGPQVLQPTFPARRCLLFGTNRQYERLDAVQLHVLPYTAKHAFRLFDLPLHHGDPFDRQVIAQALAGENRGGHPR